jgi:hypothetical protein
MRLALAAVLIATLGGCSDKKPAPKERRQTSGPIGSIVHKTDVTYRLDAVRHRVPLASTPLAGWIGLQVSGEVELDADVTMPLVDNKPAYDRANGTIAVHCIDRCQIGDDVAKLKPDIKDPTKAAFIGDGLDVGHLDITGLEVTVEIEDGHARLVGHVLKSADVTVDVDVTAQLAADLAASTGSGCIHFKPTEALKQRSPKTYTMLTLIGALPDDTGTMNITVTSASGAREIKPALCVIP